MYFYTVQDGSGTISTKELLPVLRSIGQNPTEDEILNLVIEYDVNGDGTIDFDEFLEMMSKHTRETVDQTAEMREAFKIFDRDGNGYIDFKVRAARCSIGIAAHGSRLGGEWNWKRPMGGLFWRPFPSQGNL